jgi:hypothetical protein
MTSEVGRRGEVIGLAVAIGVFAAFVGGIVKLMRLRRGECDGLGEPSSNRVGLADLGDGIYGPSPLVGLGIDSRDSRSTRVNFANPRVGCCDVRGEF